MQKDKTEDTNIFRWKTPFGSKTTEHFFSNCLLLLFKREVITSFFIVTTKGGFNPLIHRLQLVGHY